ncbi:hypothetical protein TELCIR_09482 [Teladorsagia circumcincta]|uniref:C-type lectin domain-containing protein n=1 Tax=Teladorsagia circumcincta TaxID=45464 RepID=A0A2G9UEP4_TELCI|nr:hypothetical protein TELCIR_09482 [Teladorsagia circumcincta]
MMVFLCTFFPALEAIDPNTIRRAKDGLWVGLPDVNEEEASILKLVKAKTAFSGSTLSYEKAEEFCNKDGANLASIHSNEEGQFIRGHYHRSYALIL